MKNELKTPYLPLDSEDYINQIFPDFISNGKSKKIKCKDLGKNFAQINMYFLDYLKKYHVPVASVKLVDENIIKYLRYTEIEFSVRILNYVDKRTSKIFKKKENEILDLPVYEYHYGNESKNLVSESHLISFNLINFEKLKIINRICSKVNAVLRSYFERRGKFLGEVTCTFGEHTNKIYLVNDFTPISLKILNLNKDNNSIDPYKLDTPSSVRKYTDFIFNLTKLI